MSSILDALRKAQKHGPSEEHAEPRVAHADPEPQVETAAAGSEAAARDSFDDPRPTVSTRERSTSNLTIVSLAVLGAGLGFYVAKLWTGAWTPSGLLRKARQATVSKGPAAKGAQRLRAETAGGAGERGKAAQKPLGSAAPADAAKSPTTVAKATAAPGPQPSQLGAGSQAAAGAVGARGTAAAVAPPALPPATGSSVPGQGLAPGPGAPVSAPLPAQPPAPPAAGAATGAAGLGAAPGQAPGAAPANVAKAQSPPAGSAPGGLTVVAQPPAASAWQSQGLQPAANAAAPGVAVPGAGAAGTGVPAAKPPAPTPVAPAAHASLPAAALPGTEIPQAPVLQAPPSGAPEVTLLFIQYSRNPARRVASLRVAGGKLMLVHEGDTFEGMRVATIRSDALELEWGGTRFLMLAVR